jgi:hypothetical protein
VPIPAKYRDELIAKHERAHLAARGDTLRDLVRTGGHLAFWVACGLSLIALALHTTNLALGMVFWWAGHAVWLAGVGFSLLAAYRRGVLRGDWA